MSISLTMLWVSIANTVGVASRRMTPYGDPDVSTCAVAECRQFEPWGRDFLRDRCQGDKLADGRTVTRPQARGFDRRGGPLDDEGRPRIILGGPS